MTTIKFYRVSLYIFVFILTTTFQFSTFAQKRNPPGTILLKENLFIDETPICNIHYREYQYFLSNFVHYNLDTFAIFIKKLPYYKYDHSSFYKMTNFKHQDDSLKYIISDTVKKFWSNWFDFNSYLNHPSFNYYLVVNVNSDIANSFCRWRTYVVKLLYASQPKESDRKKLYDNFEYRLPTYDELQFAIKKFQVEKKLQISIASKADSLPSFGFTKNGKGLDKFFISNVFELCKDDTKYMKTSWDINKKTIIQKTEVTTYVYNENLTFRCVCEIK